MIRTKIFKTTDHNTKLRTFLNKYQKDPSTPVIKGRSHNSRPYIPMEINGVMTLMCPDTGKKIGIPGKLMRRFNDAN